MNQIGEKIVARHNQLLRSLDSLSMAVISDAEGSHTLWLAGFLRHRLLPHIQGEERELYGLVDRLLASDCMKSTAGLTSDHRFLEQQIFRIDHALTKAHLENSRPAQANSAELEKLLAELAAVLRLHLQKEEHIYSTLLRCCAADSVGPEVLLRMQRVFDGKPLVASSGGFCAAYPGEVR